MTFDSHHINREDQVTEVSELTPTVSPIEYEYSHAPTRDILGTNNGTERRRGRFVEEEEKETQKQSNTQVSETEFESRDPGFAKTPLLWDWWLWEIAGIILSLVVTAAIIIILAMYDGQPLPNWPYHITLNAMLSVLSTIAKSSMLLAATQCISQSKWLLFAREPQRLIDFYTIDEASRGPFGALSLLIRLKGRAVLASVGAFIVFTSLGIDPFTQQVLSYPLKAIVAAQGEAPNIPRMQNWSSPLANDSQILFDKNAHDIESALPLAMKATIYNTLLNLGVTNSTVNFDCPTGNCTFNPITTLGFCSSCQDLTDTVAPECFSTCGNGNVNSTVNCTKPDLEAQISEFESADFSINCAYNLLSPAEDDPRVPNMFKLYLNTTLSREENLSTDSGPPPEKESTLVHSTNMSTATLQAGWAFIDVPSPMIAFGRAITKDSSPALEIKANVTGCALTLCVQTLNTTIQNGILHQTTVSSWRNDSSSLRGDTWLSPPNGPKNTGAAGDLPFYVDPTSQVSLSAFLSDVLTTNVTSRYIPPELVNKVQLPVGPPITYATDVAQALWLVDDLNALMSNLADRMTDTLRGFSIEYVPGTAYELQPRVAVNWGWLVLPVTLVLLSSILLIVAIISSHRHHTTAWKSNSLATLFHGLSNPEQDLTYLASSKEMATVARRRQVQLRPDADDVLRLVDSQPPIDEETKSSLRPRLRIFRANSED